MGTAAFDDAETGPVPTALVAITVKVYELPATRLATVTGLVVHVVVDTTEPSAARAVTA